MASGSQKMTTYLAKQVIGSNVAANPEGALLQSGAGRADDSATGDTWLFLNTVNSATNPWGIFHSQVDNKIKIIGDGTDDFWVDMDTGDTYILGNLSTGSILTVRAQNDTHEGGEIVLSPATDSFSTIHMDAYDSMFRLHDGTNERFKVDISSGNTTINGNLGIGADYAVLGGSYKLYVNGTTCLTDNLIFQVSNGAGIYYKGTYNTYRMIRFIDGTDEYGNGISIGGGGLTVLGSGESSDTILSNLNLTSSGGTETTYICSDSNIEFYPTQQSYNAGYKISMYNNRLWVGVDGDTSSEGQIGVRSGGGSLYLWSSSSTTGDKGLYVLAHGTGGAKDIIRINTNNVVTYAGGVFNDSISFTNSGTAFRGINYGTMGDNDQWRIGGAATAANAGYMELATADDGNEPIYVRQYTGVFSTVTRTLTLLDASGNTYVPGRLFVASNSDVGLNSGSGAIVIGSTSGTSIGIDDNEIMARSSNAASTLYINSEGGNVYIGSGGITSVGTIKSTAAPAFLAETNTGTWSYLRLHNGSNLWDIATKSNDNSGCLDFRPGGAANKGPRIWTSGMMVFANIADNASYANAAVQIREQGYGGSGSDTWGRAPRLAWHWSGRVAAQIGLASSGYLYEAPSTGTSFYKLVYESGSWGISVTGSSASCTGNAATATTASNLKSTNTAGFTTDQYCNFKHQRNTTTDYWQIQNSGGTTKFLVYYESGNAEAKGTFTATSVYHAVWNDYAECRYVETEEPGYCVTETIFGQMVKTNQRLQAGCKITSDTYGSCMGKTKIAKTPIAVAGRVLVYPYRDRQEYTLGAAVCSAPNGTVDIMTRNEIMMYPERIVGTVSEIPDYEIWRGGTQNGDNDIPVNGRIWIYVK